MPDATRRSTSMTLDRQVLEDARMLGVNISRAGEKGIREAIAERRRSDRLAENAEAITEYNAYIEQNGVPLAEYRKF